MSLDNIVFSQALMSSFLITTSTLPVNPRLRSTLLCTCKGKGKRSVYSYFMEIHLTTTECHLPYGITQCYLPPDTSEHTPPLPQPDRLVLDLPTI